MDKSTNYNPPSDQVRGRSVWHLAWHDQTTSEGSARHPYTAWSNTMPHHSTLPFISDNKKAGGGCHPNRYTVTLFSFHGRQFAGFFKQMCAICHLLVLRIDQRTEQWNVRYWRVDEVGSVSLHFHFLLIWRSTCMYASIVADYVWVWLVSPWAVWNTSEII